ncbi:natural product biosynthesis luciferase-like monooxygenase protein [Sulfitobacter undariae]|uniref:Natural product biosynthesis luciferase-like monooxygenase protein n=1 Tax=Sulfitobacter undariae TaxID=1563671 RepID=A0A7W6GZU0_9RHOB|nr:MupA/Atu3671 family FMN-dependent luciferase-like monooxygenase [Sulfitobacter undariae]MBB3992943.1 natural product biosynthesis luciferase-like monooxygenase protein [Sulfitobacter undariae]
MTASFNPSAFSCVILGDESLTIACADLIVSGGHRVVAVVSTDADVRAWADGQGVAVYARPSDLARVDLPAFDWLLSIANLRIIPEPVLALPAKGAVNFHDGPLPRYAGLNTPAWAIINGETQHGVSWHMIEGGVDEGDLLAQELIDIGGDETAFSLNSKCYAAGVESFARVMAQLESGTPERTAQDLSQRSYFARDQRPTVMGLIDFTQTTTQIMALLRGLDFGGYWNPLGLAKVAAGGAVFTVSGATLATGSGECGTVLEAAGDALVVATTDGAVRLTGLASPTGDAVPAIGTVLDASDAALGEAQKRVLADEAYWRGRLARMETLPLPLTSGEAKGEWTQRHVSLPQGTDREAAVQAILAAAVSGAGVPAGDIGHAVTPADVRFAAPWVPLNSDEPLAAQLARIANTAGFAADLPHRDPAITAQTPATMLADAPVAGSALTYVIAECQITLHGDTGLLSDVAMDILAARLAHSLAGGTGLAESERAQLLNGWNATKVAYTADPVHVDFEAQVARTPDATALVFEDQTLSYAALNAAANRLAHRLVAQGVTKGTPVGLSTSRGPDLLIGALGILKAGGAYVPLDPAYPADRIKHYIADSGAPVIVTQSALAESLPKGDAALVVLDIDTQLAAQLDTNPDAGADGSTLAYLIYTSGSTGTPKGVMVSHGNVANFFAGMDDRISHKDGDAWLAVTSLSFDISVLELFWTLSRGFKLVLAGDDSRTELSKGPIAVSDAKIDFSLYYWGNDGGVGPEKYRLLLEGAKFADTHGFNAVWTPERHFHAFGGPYPNPSVTGAAVAAVTNNLAVRAGSCVAPLHHPARIAEEWAVIDNLTNGRVGLAIASGWQPDDFVLRPENTPPNNKPAMFTTIDQLRALWRGDAVEFPTKDGTPFAVVTQPRPVSKELPVWVTTAGNPATWKEAGAIGANVLTHLLGQSVEEVGEKIKLYHAALREAGHDPADFKVTLMLHTYLSDSRVHAEDVAREPMKEYLRSAAGLIKQYAWAFPAFKRPEGATNPFEVNLDGLDDEEMEAILEFAFQRYFNDSGLFGTVDDAVARTEELKRIGVNEIACLIDYGIDVDAVMDSLIPLAEVLSRANAGAALAEDDFSLAAQLMRHKVSHMQCTPSMAQMMVMNDETRFALSGLRELMVGGEALPGALAAELIQACGGRVQNMYGPTETTIWSTTQMVTQPETTAAIGTPIANTQTYVLDETLTPRPVGVAGELYIAGDGVTLGYHDRPEMTAERFVDNPFGSGKMYRTGDLAMWRCDGSLGFMGRADDQVKIRGHRIELGEIESALAAQAGITQAVVVAREARGGAQLVGYVTGSNINEDALRRALSATLPDIMVPARIVEVARMPLTPNKKIDRKALPAPTAKVAPSAALDAPVQGGTQAAIAQVWTAILGVANIRPSDNFFSLGGHSLLAVQAHRDIKAALGVDKLGITDIFRFPTLEGLAAHLDKGKVAVAEVPAEAAPAKAETISKRRAMRAGRAKADS